MMIAYTISQKCIKRGTKASSDRCTTISKGEMRIKRWYTASVHTAPQATVRGCTEECGTITCDIKKVYENAFHTQDKLNRVPSAFKRTSASVNWDFGQLLFMKWTLLNVPHCNTLCVLTANPTFECDARACSILHSVQYTNNNLNNHNNNSSSSSGNNNKWTLREQPSHYVHNRTMDHFVSVVAGNNNNKNPEPLFIWFYHRLHEAIAVN